MEEQNRSIKDALADMAQMAKENAMKLEEEVRGALSINTDKIEEKNRINFAEIIDGSTEADGETISPEQGKENPQPHPGTLEEIKKVNFADIIDSSTDALKETMALEAWKESRKDISSTSSDAEAEQQDKTVPVTLIEEVTPSEQGEL
jgi:hypothetical protein